MAHRFQIVAVLLAGILAGLTFGWGSAWALGGAGHGWNSSLWSILAVVLLPMLGVGFLTQDCGSVKRIALWVTIGFITADSVILVSTALEGWSGMRRVLEAVPGRLAGWLMIWIAFHISIAFLWRKAFRISEPAASPNGGPATRLGNSGVTEGPPSVS